MEALAIRDGAILAEERDYTRVVIESDTKEVVNQCNGDDQNRSVDGNLSGVSRY
jgi:ribonuclease HI